METGNISLLEYIRQNLADGELPDGFSLPKEDEKTSMFADGAMDGISIYHSMGQEIPAESMDLVIRALGAVSKGKDKQAVELMREFFQKHSPIRAIDEIEGYIYDHTDVLNAEKVHGFALACMQSGETNLVKLGLMLIEVFSEPEESVKEMIRTLGLSDEFTIFAVFNMMHWQNANDEIFRLAAHVHGWGRIHAVERLEADTEEIREWLLAEGVQNRIVPAYSAYTVFSKADVEGMLNGEISDRQFAGIAEIITALFDEGPVSGISVVEDAGGVLAKFLSQAKRHKLTISIADTILEIWEKDQFAVLHPICEEILKGDAGRQLAEESLKEGGGVRLAKKIGVDFEEKLFAYMKQDFEKGYVHCPDLIKSEQYRQQTIELFRERLPLADMASEPQDQMGLGAEYAKYKNYHMLVYAVQCLADYPLCGSELVLAALRSPVINNRNMALRVLDSWCKIRECRLKELSQELFLEVEHLKVAEVSDSVKENLEKFGF